MEYASDTNNNDKNVVDIETSENVVVDKTDNSMVTTPVSENREVIEIPSADLEATNPTNNIDSTKERNKSCAKKQLKLPKATKKTSPIQSKLTNKIKRNNRIIYSLKLRCPKSKDPMKTMQEKLQEWFK